MVSHEINQPLGAITNYLGGISLRYEEVLRQNPELKETLNETLRLAKRTSDIIQGIRNLVRRRTEDVAPVDMKELIEETLMLLHAECDRRRIHLTTRFDEDAPNLHGERIQLQQLLLNLFMNAMDALETTAVDPRQLSVALDKASGGHLKVSITDNGNGIKSDDSDRIFDPFFSTKESGVGLGLSICKSIVEAHGGLIFAKSLPTGTQFTFELPSEGEKG